MVRLKKLLAEEREAQNKKKIEGIIKGVIWKTTIMKAQLLSLLRVAYFHQRSTAIVQQSYRA